MDQTVVVAVIIGLAAFLVFVWRYFEPSDNQACPTDTKDNKYRYEESVKTDVKHRIVSLETDRESITPIDVDSWTSKQTGESLHETEVVRTNLEAFMKEMDSGSCGLEQADIEPFQQQVMESLNRDNGNLKKLLMDAKHNYGIEGLHDALQHELNKWNDVKLKIGITGGSGTGKSTLINTLRGILPNHPHAAKVGVTETTTEPTSYPHPHLQNVEYVDLPGIGTMNFKKENYVEKTRLQDYDMFIIVGCRRYTLNDAWLASECLKINKKVLIVRTNIDIDMHNQKTDFPDVFKEKLVLTNIKKSTEDSMNELADESNIERTIIANIPIFLVSAKLGDIRKYDFKDLHQTMTDALPDIKKEVMVMALTAVTESAIDEKMKIIEKRCQTIMTALSISLRIPGINILSELVIGKIVAREINIYRQQLGIDDDSIRQMNIDLKSLDLIITPSSKCEHLLSGYQSPLYLLYIPSHWSCSSLAKCRLLSVLKSDAIKILEHLNRNIIN